MKPTCGLILLKHICFPTSLGCSVTQSLAATYPLAPSQPPTGPPPVSRTVLGGQDSWTGDPHPLSASKASSHAGQLTVAGVSNNQRREKEPCLRADCKAKAAPRTVPGGRGLTLAWGARQADRVTLGIAAEGRWRTMRDERERGGARLGVVTEETTCRPPAGTLGGNDDRS